MGGGGEAFSFWHITGIKTFAKYGGFHGSQSSFYNDRCD